MIDSIDSFPVINSLNQNQQYYQNMFEIKTKLQFTNAYELKKRILNENGKTFSLASLQGSAHFKSIKQKANESFFKDSHKSSNKVTQSKLIKSSRSLKSLKRLNESVRIEKSQFSRKIVEDRLNKT